MGAACNLYVYDPDRKHVKNKALHDVVVEDELPWIAATGDFELPMTTLRELSAKLKTDVVLLGFQSTVDAFLYRHAKDGELVRDLVYGCFKSEGEWESVAGSPQAWETEVFYSRSEMKRKIEFYLKALKNKKRASYLGHDRQELMAALAENRKRDLAALSYLDARESARGVAYFLGLPHWEVQNDPASLWFVPPQRSE